jgi:hypothetical protein
MYDDVTPRLMSNVCRPRESHAAMMASSQTVCLRGFLFTWHFKKKKNTNSIYFF